MTGIYFEYVNAGVIFTSFEFELSFNLIPIECVFFSISFFFFFFCFSFFVFLFLATEILFVNKIVVEFNSNCNALHTFLKRRH